MSTTSIDRLYSLLPAIYRVRDVENGEPLRALMEVMEQQFLAVEQDIANLYDNWFIETADEWAVPYIGELLGTRRLHSVPNGAFSLRSYVGNTFAYRQAKGTAAILEQLARDVTGWPARVVEFFQVLGTTQYLEHRRPQIQLADLRNVNQLELIDTPFDRIPHTVDVRRIVPRRGRYNIPNVGIFLWRLRSYRMLRSRGIAVGYAGGNPEGSTNVGDGRYFISPILRDLQLFNNVQSETAIMHLAEEVNVPGPLRRRPLFEELVARREALAAAAVPVEVYFGAQPPFRIYKNGSSTPVDPKDIYVCDLSAWRRPPTGIVSVDPVLGRIAFATGQTPTKVHVDYTYGFSADIGGGTYNRSESLTEVNGTWYRTVGKTGANYTTVQDAVDAWMALPLINRLDGLIEIIDSDLYGADAGGNLQDVDIPEGSTLTIQAKDGQRPVLYLDFQLGSPDTDPMGRLILNGVMIVGKITTEDTGGELDVMHCTIIPRAGGNGTAISCTNDEMRVGITSSITGHIELGSALEPATISDSIIDGIGFPQTGAGAGYAIGTSTTSGPPLTIQRCTLFGKVHVREMRLASEVIFNQQITVKRRQIGCIRFSYVAPGSRTPRRYRCQPDGSVQDRTDLSRTVATARVRPEFTSTYYGDPGYAQLSQKTATEIWTGAEDGAEMGAFNQLKQPQREANLREGLDEAMRLGLEAGIIYVT